MFQAWILIKVPPTMQSYLNFSIFSGIKSDKIESFMVPVLYGDHDKEYWNCSLNNAKENHYCLPFQYAQWLTCNFKDSNAWLSTLVEMLRSQIFYSNYEPQSQFLEINWTLKYSMRRKFDIWVYRIKHCVNARSEKLRSVQVQTKSNLAARSVSVNLLDYLLAETHLNLHISVVIPF